MNRESPASAAGHGAQKALSPDLDDIDWRASFELRRDAESKWETEER